MTELVSCIDYYGGKLANKTGVDILSIFKSTAEGTEAVAQF
jgi:hypothetical protein